MVLGFVRRAVAAAMSCFLCCFRIKDSHLVISPDPVVSSNKNVLSSLFPCDTNYKSIGKEEEDRTSCLKIEFDFMELKDEAKFLEGCQTLPETPIEIQSLSEKWGDKSDQNGRKTSSKFSSWFSNTSTEKLKLDKLYEESPSTVKLCEDRVTGSGSLEDTPSSWMTYGHNTRRGSISLIQNSDTQNITPPVDVYDSETPTATSSVSPVVFAPSVHFKNKYVQFDCESDGSAFSSKCSSSESGSQLSKQSGSSGSSSVSKLSGTSPYSTPLKLTDEMQTPGTVFPAYMSNMAIGKATRIRSQYVYSVLNPVENPSKWEELKDEISDSDNLRESLDPNHETTLMSTPTLDMAIKDLSVGKGINYEASLSSWLKPSSPEQDGDNVQICSFSGENFHFGRIPGDRSILGMAAAHWNDEETSQISPTMWDGNGIPNSTSKYKEEACEWNKS